MYLNMYVCLFLKMYSLFVKRWNVCWNFLTVEKLFRCRLDFFGRKSIWCLLVRLLLLFFCFYINWSSSQWCWKIVMFVLFVYFFFVFFYLIFFLLLFFWFFELLLSQGRRRKCAGCSNIFQIALMDFCWGLAASCRIL